jgi:hypothetical protein
MPEEDNKVLEAKKPVFYSRYGFWDFIFLFLVELGTCLHNLIPKKSVEHYFPQGGVLKFTYKDIFLQ